MESVQLHYRASEYRGFDEFIHARPDYYRVTEYPVAEMSGADPVVWAEDFVRQAASTDWHLKNRRRVQPGDLMISGNRIWLFIAANDAAERDAPLPNCPTLAIKSLGPTTSQILLAVLNYIDGTSGAT